MHSQRARQRLAHHVRELERLAEEKTEAAAALADAFATAKTEGYDPATLKVVLKLRKMTSSQRRERRALEAIYMAALGILDGDPLPDEARRRLSGEEDEKPSARKERDRDGEGDADASSDTPPETSAQPPPAQPPLIAKDPDEARQEGAAAATAGQRIYDNPYPAGDPCRAAWDEGWCGQRNSHGMDVPKAYQRRLPEMPPKKPDDKKGERRDDERGAA